MKRSSGGSPDSATPFTKISCVVGTKTNSLVNSDFLQGSASHVELLNWSVDQVCTWLQQGGFTMYCDAFKQLGITGARLVQLQSTDLREYFHVRSYRDRKRLLTAIGNIKTKEEAYGHIKLPVLSPSMSKSKKLALLQHIASQLSKLGPKYITDMFLHLLKDGNAEIRSIQRLLLHFSQELFYSVLQESKYCAHDVQIFTEAYLNIYKRIEVKQHVKRGVSTAIVPHSQFASSCVDTFAPNSEQLFQQTPVDPLEEQMIHIAKPTETNLKYPPISTKEEFVRKFDAFSMHQLKHLNWSNCLVAGGCTLACLLPENHISYIQSLNETFDPSDTWQTSDIDIFLVGLNWKQIQNKTREIYSAVCRANPHNVLVVKTKNCVSFITQYPYRSIQVIQAEFSSYMDVLAEFDMDCISIGYNGQSVWMIPNAVRTFCIRTNFIEESYFAIAMNARMVKRIHKYLGRGLPNDTY